MRTGDRQLNINFPTCVSLPSLYSTRSLMHYSYIAAVVVAIATAPANRPILALSPARARRDG